MGAGEGRGSFQTSRRREVQYPARADRANSALIAVACCMDVRRSAVGLPVCALTRS
jgi:hypothetical protein